jgi:hypothetical protein
MEGIREIYEAIKTGKVDENATTNTLNWYKNLLYYKTILDRIEIGGRVI